MIIYSSITRSRSTSETSATGLSISGPIPRDAPDQKGDGNTGSSSYTVPYRAHNLQNHTSRKPEHYPGSNSRILCTSNKRSFTDATNVLLAGYRPRQTSRAQAIALLTQRSLLHSPHRHLQPRPEVHRTCRRLRQAADRLQHKCNAGQHLQHSLLQSVASPMQPLHHNPHRHLQSRLPRSQQPKQPLRTNGKVGARDPTKAGGKLFVHVKCRSN